MQIDALLGVYQLHATCNHASEYDPYDRSRLGEEQKQNHIMQLEGEKKIKAREGYLCRNRRKRVSSEEKDVEVNIGRGIKKEEEQSERKGEIKEKSTLHRDKALTAIGIILKQHLFHSVSGITLSLPRSELSTVFTLPQVLFFIYFHFKASTSSMSLVLFLVRCIKDNTII